MPNDDPNLNENNENNEEGLNSSEGNGGGITQGDSFGDDGDFDEPAEQPEQEETVGVTAISQSEWWKKIYEDEENAQTAKHLI